MISLFLLARVISYGMEQPNIVLILADDGCGMTAEVQQHLFEPFFTRRASGQGTGLGLSIVKHIAQTLGGRVWVESEVGRGSTFFFTLNSSVTKDQSPQPSSDELSSAA